MELKRGLEAALHRGDGSTARRLLREAARDANRATLAEEPDLVSLAMRACSKGRRHADVLDLHDVLNKAGSSTEGDSLALIAAVSTRDWARAEHLLRALLEVGQEGPNWAEDDVLRASALATAKATGNSKVTLSLGLALPMTVHVK